MKYPEYLKTAERHLATCQKFFDSMDWTEADQWDIFNDWMKNKSPNKVKKEMLLKKKPSFDKFAREFIKYGIWLERRKHRLDLFNSALSQCEKSQEKENNLKRLQKKKESLDKFASTFEKKSTWYERRKHRLNLFNSVLSQWEESLKKEKENESKLKNLNNLLIENCLLKDIYYLTGYILEAFTVYLVYRRGGFSPEKDITELDITFSQNNHIDFYKTHTEIIDGKEKNVSNRREKKNDSIFNKDLDELNKVMQDAKYFYSIEGHKFSQIILYVLRNPELGLIKPSEKNIPLISKPFNKQTENMIRLWESHLRYSSEEDTDTWNQINLSPQSIKLFIDLCEKIKNHPCYKL